MFVEEILRPADGHWGSTRFIEGKQICINCTVDTLVCSRYTSLVVGALIFVDDT